MKPYTVCKVSGREVNAYRNFVFQDRRYLISDNFYLILAEACANTITLSYEEFDELDPELEVHLPPEKLKFGTFEEYAETLVAQHHGEFFVAPNDHPKLAELLNKHYTDEADVQILRSTAVHHQIGRLYQPIFIKEDRSSLSIYKTAKDWKRGRRTVMKFGRAIRWMMPELSDFTIESISKAYIDLYAERVYILHTGETRENFAHAYSDNLSRSYNPATSSSRKALHNSCMRGVETDTGISPAECYASGDFQVTWLECEEGKIAGRVVVLKGTEDCDAQAGPVYGVCEQSLDLLEAHLEKIGARNYDNDSSWSGAKLLKLEDCGGLIGPYSDMEECVSTSDCGEYLIFDSRGEHTLSSTSGYIEEEGMEYCADCGDRFNMEDGDGGYVDDHGCVCDSCLQYNYTYVEDLEQYVHDQHVIQVRSRALSNTVTVTVNYSTDYDGYVFCDCVDELWEFDDTTYSKTYQDYVPTHMIGDFPEMFAEEEEEKEEAA